MKNGFWHTMAAVGCAWFCLALIAQAADVKPAAKDNKAAKVEKAVKSPSPAVDRAAKRLFEKLKDKDAAVLTQEELKTAEPDIVKTLAQLTRDRVIGGTRPLAEADEVDLADKEQVTLDDFIPYLYARAAKQDAEIREARKEALASKKAAAAAPRAANRPQRDPDDRYSREDVRRLENQRDELEYRNWQLQQQFNQAQNLNQLQRQQQIQQQQQQQQQGGGANKPINLGNLSTQQKPVAGSGNRPTSNRPNIDKPSSRPNKPSSRPEKPSSKPAK